MQSVELLVVIVLVGWLMWVLIRSLTRRSASRGRGVPGPAVRPRVPQARGQGGVDPSAPPPAGDAGRRPALTVAAEIAGILALFIALLSLIAH